MIKGIIFDFDGVITDSEVLYVESVVAYLEGIGIRTTFDSVQHVIGQNMNDIAASLIEQFHLDLTVDQVIEDSSKVYQKMFDYNRFKAILHGTYHSGTACAEDNENSVLQMIKLCKKSDIYLSPSIPEGEVYDTVRVIDENKKIKFLYGLTNEMAYAKLLIAYSVFNNENDISEFINTEYNYEITEKR